MTMDLRGCRSALTRRPSSPLTLSLADAHACIGLSSAAVRWVGFSGCFDFVQRVPRSTALVSCSFVTHRGGFANSRVRDVLGVCVLLASVPERADACMAYLVRPNVRAKTRAEADAAWPRKDNLHHDLVRPSGGCRSASALERGVRPHSRSFLTSLRTRETLPICSGSRRLPWAARYESTSNRLRLA